jgi:DNA-binding XRE family transcriptional regulator
MLTGDRDQAIRNLIGVFTLRPSEAAAIYEAFERSMGLEAASRMLCERLAASSSGIFRRVDRMPVIQLRAPSAVPRSLGAKIAEARKAKRLTQKQLAAVLGIQPWSVGRWEIDSLCPTVNALIRIARALHVPPASLLPD